MRVIGGFALVESSKKQYLIGISCTLLGAIFWGFSGASSEYLMEVYHLPAPWISMVRMLCAGIILFVWLSFKQMDGLKGIWKDKVSWKSLLAFSIVGLMANQLTYLMAISHTNAGTATVLQYIAPVFILAYICLKSHKKPNRKELIGISLTLAGIFLITTHGNIQSLVISPLGLSWGILSAITLAIYNLVPIKIIRKWGSLVVTCYGMLIGGVVGALLFQQWRIKVELDLSALGALFVVVVFGTVIPYTLYLKGVEQIGAVKASMIASVEPLAATVFTAILLGTKFTMIDIIGFLLIIATVILLAYKEEKKQHEKKKINKTSLT